MKNSATGANFHKLSKRETYTANEKRKRREREKTTKEERSYTEEESNGRREAFSLLSLLLTICRSLSVSLLFVLSLTSIDIEVVDGLQCDNHSRHLYTRDALQNALEERIRFLQKE